MIVKTIILWLSWLPVSLFSITPDRPGRLAHFKTELKHGTDFQAGDIQFVQEMVYSEPDEVMFGIITTSAVDHLGRVYLGDNDQKMIHVFSPDGEYIRSFGSQGNGPGELQMISKIAVDEKSIHVFDLIQARINVFDIDRFDFIQAIPLAENGGKIRRSAAEDSGLGRPFDFHLLTDGKYLVSYRNFRNPDRPRTAVIAPGGEILEKDRFELRAGEDEIAESSSGNRRVFATFPFSRTTTLTVSSNGLVVSNWSEHFKFEVYDESGNHIHTFSYPLQNAHIDRQELLKQYENVQTQGVIIGGRSLGSGNGSSPPPIQQMLERMELPETWPAVDRVHADTQNRLWISSFTEKMDERKWFLFTDSGNLLGTFIWPTGRSVVYADHNTVYVLDRKTDDLDSVTRYKFSIQ